MTTIEQISSTERKLHAAKFKLQVAKNEKWINRQNKPKKQLKEAINQAETEVDEYRKTLAKLIVKHYKIELCQLLN